jgi:ribonuclease T2
MAKRPFLIASVSVLLGLFVGAFGYASLASRGDDGGRGAWTAKSDVPRGTGFDFYLLALSWSPSYCADPGAQARDAVQCAGPRPFAFVVHGLWPQYERGFPRACRTSQSRPNEQAVRAMLDIMPSPRLVQHQWENHGTCSGLSAADYLKVTRLAREAVAIPQRFVAVSDWQTLSAGEVEAAFVQANPAMSRAGIAVSQRRNLLSEVRICLTLELEPRACPEVDGRGANDRTRLSMPPVRG